MSAAGRGACAWARLGGLSFRSSSNCFIDHTSSASTRISTLNSLKPIRAINGSPFRTSSLTTAISASVKMGGGGEKVPGQYMGWWGSLGSPPQKGVATYSLSSNRQRPLAGALNAAVFNTWRRFRGQVLYVVPPFAIAYVTMQWAIKRNEFLNSKEGRIVEGGPDL